MQIAVRSRHVEVPAEIRAQAMEKLERLERFLEGMDQAEVRFSEEQNPRIADREICEVTLHGHGHVVRAKASATDVLAAVDRVVAKLEHSLTKLKGKLVGRSHPRRADTKLDGPVPLLDPDTLAPLPESSTKSNGKRSVGDRVIRTKRFEMKPMSPDEAILQMELVGHDFYLFCNVENGQSAVLYTRNDGEIGMIEAL